LVADLPARRPDLIALKLGYASQDEKYYAAILGQFPALVFGGSGGHDTSAIYTIGPNVTMDLPIFNRNQGNIAIEKATRQKLHDEYTDRLTADVAEIRGLLADQVLLQSQLAAARDAAAEAERAAQGAQSAYASLLIDARSYADLVAAALTRKQEVVTLEQGLLDQQVALATLTGIAMPVAEPIPEAAGGHTP
jgi:outer membrane protein TolC